jgi:eukaryotic-like serine/threonine-protein kinase
MAGPDVVAGRFALCDPLARGAAGTVWRAWDLRRGDWCAAKVMRQRDAGDLLRFAREQSLRLHHPHLLAPYTWAAEDAHVAIVSPLVAGGSLHTLLGDHGPLAPDLVADLLDQLLDGLDYVHGAGIVHRDVTPANVLLEATGSGRPLLRLTDFGLAVRIGEPRLTRLGTVLGTPGYVPPEVLAGAAPAPAADLYAAGRVAIALLTGADPDGPVDPPGTGALHDVVTALVAPDPADRPATAAAARRALGPVPPAHSPATATGDLVTVLHQLPELPPGWTPTGPSTGAATGPVPFPATRAGEPPGPRSEAAPPPPAPAPGNAPAGAGPATNRPAGAGPATNRPDGAGPATSGPDGGGPAGGGLPVPHRERSRWRWRRPVAAGAVGLAIAVSVGTGLLADRGGDPPDVTPTPSPSGAAVVSGPAADGGTCGWQQEGDAARDGGGRALRCVRTEAGYRWQLS